MTLIEQIIAAKQGDKGFVLTNEHRHEWCAAIGNMSKYVPIGEAIAYGDGAAEFIAYGATPEGALEALLVKVQAG